MCHIFFIHSSVGGHLGCFHARQISSSSARGGGATVAFDELYKVQVLILPFSFLFIQTEMFWSIFESAFSFPWSPYLPSPEPLLW